MRRTQLPRIIPVLLLSGRRLVKTLGFGRPAYVGDPINVVRIFNDKEIDELCILNIDPSRGRARPDWDYLEQIVSECFVPVALGGGVDSLDAARRMFGLGADKVVLNSAAVRRPKLISEIAQQFGSQAVVLSLDAKRPLFRRHYQVYVDGGRSRVPDDLTHYVTTGQAHGCGEILINSIVDDGSRDGFDLTLIEQVSRASRVPVIACGGAGALADLLPAVQQAGASAVAAGSLFCFQTHRQSVLISYPTRAQARSLWCRDG